MNKFDYMMEIIAETSVNFAQVLAIDQQFGLFHRAWCIAELAEARLLRMPQHATWMARFWSHVEPWRSHLNLPEVSKSDVY